MPLDFTKMTLGEVLHSYSSVKGHHTSCEKETVKLLVLLNTQYSSSSETRVNDHLENLEKHALWLSDITGYLVSTKYAKACHHQVEVTDFLEVLDKVSSDIFTVLNDLHAAAQAVTNPAQKQPAA